jgi:NAD+ kinase
MPRQIKNLGFFYRPDSAKALFWEKKIRSWLKTRFPKTKVTDRQPEALIVLGGDGTILEAARRYRTKSPLIFGLNLGRVGFLASARKEAEFLPSLAKFLKGEYWQTERTMMTAAVIRQGRTVFKTEALNDVIVENPLGMVEIEIGIDDHPFQTIQGTGALVATATGSTAYNLSAHGPIVMPDIKCLILTEILDHNIPTPSIVVGSDKTINMRVLSFRERNVLSLTKDKEPLEVMLVADGETVFPLLKKDCIIVRSSPRLVRLAETEKNYFLRSLRTKFSFE